MTERVRQVEAIENGTVIDHIPNHATLKVAQVLAGDEDRLFIGNNLPSKQLGHKGVVKIAGRELSSEDISRLAIIAPEATISFIRNYKVVGKQQIPVPDRFKALAQCLNPNCVTNHEPCATDFKVIEGSPLRVTCSYCERHFDGRELTLLPNS